ncbi:hypothetical protein [Phycisphaera mikurensis]|uniref:Uncharacterized protein n=1 Tax=Phycisphaera mikurensis (strain NBRC 102666 / KCTC 22515 / FYK2301M01) TaxID=1142394 RepID=I0IE91_PHYMF|nr:hypothetical protein [Phycisphaera mikurensis]MBB6441382.1 hypothetical protein [Phycisphaera mikurensis]BAM03579.1 hypothetical protein PSMK_14200 [Phycisphaera mikurensis NBRC 102666]
MTRNPHEKGAAPRTTLPDADGLRERLEETQPHPVPASRRALPIAAVGLALLAALAGPPLIGTLAPWLVLGGIALLAVRRARQSRRVGEGLEQAETLLRTRRPAAAYHAADAWLDDTVHEPAASAGCLHVMAQALQTLRHQEATLVATEALLERLPPHHPARASALLHRSIAEFESDRLADGDATLGRLRGLLEKREPVEPVEPAGEDPQAGHAGDDRRVGRPFPPADRAAEEHAHAAVRVAQLVQSVSTWHAADAVADAESAGGAVAAFRPLGVDAGFAHGLLAWCHLKLHRAEDAAAAWAVATRLIPAPALVHRFPRLAEVAERCPATGGLPT